MKKENISSGYEAVKRLAEDHPGWLVVVEAALEVSKSTVSSNRLPGSRVWKRTMVKGIKWKLTNFTRLVKYGILERQGEATRGGRRRYYSMPDPEGVERALRELKCSG